MLRIFQVAALAALFAFGAADVSDAVEVRSVRVAESASLPKVQPNWPVPRDKGQAFYLQRSTNKNTIVYAARFDAAGNLDPKNPVAVYWRRFNDDGAAKGLKRIEHLLYGVRTRAGAQPGTFTVSLRRLPQLAMQVRQTGPGAVELLMRVGGKTVVPVYAYAEVDSSGLIDQLTGFTVFGRDPATGAYVSETFAVSGGAIRP
jgi:hypothetical protein